VALDKFTAVGSTFTDCRFDRARIKQAAFGSGMEPSQYVGCSFDGTSLRALGGFTRFVNCTFRNLQVAKAAPDYLEFVDCTFTGKITGLQFWGAPPSGPTLYASLTTTLARSGTPEPPGLEQLVMRNRNEIRGNDFSEAELVKVSFRFGVDLTAQKLPVGEDYLYLPDAETTLLHALAGLAPDQSDEARKAREFLQDLLERNVAHGQRQLWLRPKNFERHDAVPGYVMLAVDELRRVIRRT
jgi:hypothetical protein